VSMLVTYSGRQVDLMAPSPKQLDIGDIAHALALQCRYNGHTERFYSVAEHSLLVADLVEAEVRGRPDAAQTVRTALLHDAAEAYLGDIVSPLKFSPPMLGYLCVESEWNAVIAQRYGLCYVLPPVVRQADEALLGLEMATLLAAPPSGAAIPRGIVSDFPQQVVTFHCHDWRVAEQLFLARWAQLEEQEGAVADDDSVYGYCDVCGCTDDRGCVLDAATGRTCEWANDAHTLCTGCSGKAVAR